MVGNGVDDRLLAARVPLRRHGARGEVHRGQDRLLGRRHHRRRQLRLPEGRGARQGRGREHLARQPVRPARRLGRLHHLHQRAHRPGQDRRGLGGERPGGQRSTAGSPPPRPRWARTSSSSTSRPTRTTRAPYNDYVLVAGWYDPTASVVIQLKGPNAADTLSCGYGACEDAQQRHDRLHDVHRQPERRRRASAAPARPASSRSRSTTPPRASGPASATGPSTSSRTTRPASARAWTRGSTPSQLGAAGVLPVMTTGLDLTTHRRRAGRRRQRLRRGRPRRRSRRGTPAAAAAPTPSTRRRR